MSAGTQTEDISASDVEAFYKKLAAWGSGLPEQEQAMLGTLLSSADRDDAQGYAETAASPLGSWVFGKALEILWDDLKAGGILGKVAKQAQATKSK